MKYLLFVILSALFFTAQAQDKVFNPLEKRAEFCQRFEDVKKNLSCEGEDCPPLYESSVDLSVQWLAADSCSFECIVGQQMCDTTLHPGGEVEARVRYSARSCPDSSNAEAFEVNIAEVYHDEEGIEHIEEVRTHKETGCEEWTTYVKICSDDKSCEKIEKYSDEWFEYERQQQLKAYEESCFIPTEDDCKKVEQEMLQCVLEVATHMSESFCTPSTDNLWEWRHGRDSWDFIDMRQYEGRQYKDTEPSPTPIIEESFEGEAAPSE